jgi:hypothetical protein
MKTLYHSGYWVAGLRLFGQWERVHPVAPELGRRAAAVSLDQPVLLGINWLTTPFRDALGAWRAFLWCPAPVLSSRTWRRLERGWASGF